MAPVKRRIYVETTIPSFYYEVRAATDMAARRAWTREWWEKAKNRDELVTSAPVLDGLFVPSLVTPLELLGDPDE